MGITTSMGLLKFALLGIDLLGWPVIALGYPLFASIRAVETGSRYQMRKLVIYWTLFSLFSLFEFTFVKIIEWIPLWSGVRLVVSFLLVMPQFDGACLAYQGLVRSVIDRFGMLKEDRLFKRQMFLEVVEKYIKENGSEALEKLIALEVRYKQLISSARVSNVTYVVSNVKQMTTPEARVENRSPETPPLKKTQQEWTCDLCKVTTVGESTLNAHLQGSEHKSKLESLKACLLDAKDTGPSPWRQVQHAHSLNAAWDLKGTYKERMPPKQPENPLLKKAQQEWTCDLCNVTTASKSMLNAHLQGSKHKSKLESPKVSLLDATDTAPSPLVQQAQSVTAAWDLNGTYTSAEDREIMPQKETAEMRRPETPLLKKAQQEWTFDPCKVTTESESTLNDHLQGSKHNSRLETTLEASLLDAKDTGPSTSVQQAQSVTAAWDLNGTYTSAEDREIMPQKETAERRRPETPLLKKVQQEWTCDPCKFTTESESTLNDHLQGSKHKSRLETTLEGSLLDAKDAGPSPSVQQAQSVTAARDLNGTYTSAEDREIMPQKEAAERRRPETPLLKKAQQEWTCDTCKVTTESESTLNDHLQGSKHKSRLETTLEASLLDAKDIGPSPSVQHAQSVSAAWDLKGTYAAAEDKEILPQKETAEDRCPETPLLKKAQQQWTVDLCKVTTTNDITFNNHLNGRKHKAKLETTLKESLLDAKDTGPSPLVQHAQLVTAAWELNGTYTPAEDRDIMPQKETAERRRPETNILKKAQQEWTCDPCKFTAESESMLNDHLQGSKDKSMLETTLKASLLDAKDTGPSPSVQHAQSVSAAWELTGTYAPSEDKEILPQKETAEDRRPETPLLKKGQQHWTCDLCKVTTTNEITFNGHLNGRKHKSKLETTLKESLLDAKDTGPSPLVQHARSVTAAWDLNGTYTSAEDIGIMPQKETAERRRPETPLLKKAQQEWTCDPCKVTTESESTLNDHLQGSKHKSRLETTLEASLFDTKDTGPSPSVQQVQSVTAAWDLNGMYTSAEDSEIMPQKESAGRRRLESPLLKKALQEWTCDPCKVTTESEFTLNDHLQGSEHKSRLVTTLEASLLDAKDIGPSPSVPHGQSVSAAWELKGTYAAAEDKEILPQKETAEDRRPETPLLKKAQQQWTCDLCKVTTTNEITFSGHLNGRKHKAKLKTTLKESLLDAKVTGPSPLVQHAQSVSSAWYLNGTLSASEDKEIMPLKETAENRLQESSLLEKDQHEWAADLCKVTTESESTLNDHLQGSKQKSKLEPTLEASLLDAKDTAGPSPSVQHAQLGSAAWDLGGTHATAEVKEIMPSKEPRLKKARQEWTCELCMVTTTSEISLNGHLHGSKHKAKLESSLKECLLELGKLVASKTGQGECSDSHRDVQVVESEAKNGSAASQQQVQYTQSTEVPKRTDANAEVKEMTPPETSRAETPPLKKEWSCGLCKVKATSEKNLNAHLLGSKHKSQLESLKTWKGNLIVLEINGVFKHWCIVCDAKLLSDVDLASHLKGKRHASNIEEMEKLGKK